MDKSRFQLADDLWLDARRALWLPQQRVLAIADLHLGYAWAARQAGNLLPVTESGEAIARLKDLQREYQPDSIVVLGDVVQRALPIAQLREEMEQFCAALKGERELVFIEGNHDRSLGELLKAWRLSAQFVSEHSVGPHVLVHGNVSKNEGRKLRKKLGPAGRIIMGHEHPAVSVGDGVASWCKCPCFLISKDVVVLPAFSRWAAGTVFPHYPFMSELAQQARFDRAIAILAGKLLPLAFA